ncbi:MAG: PAS domain S-box protein [Pseudomonadota bacterium]
MLDRFFHRLPLPKSLQWQYIVASSVQTLLIVAGGLIAVYSLYMSSDTTRQLAEERLLHLQQAQDLVQCTLLIERESHRMLTTDSLDSMQISYLEILKKLELLDSTVLCFGRESNNLSVLSLYQNSQLFRNTVHIVTQLQKSILSNISAPHELSKQKARFLHFADELQRQAMSLVDSTRDLSTHFTFDYQETVRQLTAASKQDQMRVLMLLTGSVLLAWLISRYFLGRHVVARLQQVSKYLRLDATSAGHSQVPVRGDDEIGDMARAVEQFLKDRRLLTEAQHKLQQSEEMLRAIIQAAPTAIIGLDLDGNVHSVWNRAAERMLGWSSQEVMGHPFPTVPKENEEEFRNFREQIRKGLNLNGVEVRRNKRDGSPIDYSIYASPLHDAEGNITGNIAVLVDIAERKQIEEHKDRLVLELQKTLSEVKTLSGLLPICSYCKKIRDDKGYWNQIEAYIHDHSGAEFSHGICQECTKKYFPDLDLYND